jgi:hypothetical protein
MMYEYTSARLRTSRVSCVGRVVCCTLVETYAGGEANARLLPVLGFDTALFFALDLYQSSAAFVVTFKYHQ